MLKLKIKYNIMYTTEKEIQDRLDVIDREVGEIKSFKSSNRLSSEDIENVSDNYQYNLDCNYLLSELQDERDFLVQERNKFHLSKADFWDGDESDNFLQ
jgi:hypothetical protein